MLDFLLVLVSASRSAKVFMAVDCLCSCITSKYATDNKDCVHKSIVVQVQGIESGESVS